MHDVVVLEDDDLVRDVLTDIIETEGFAVHPSANADDALAYLDIAEGCELLLTDIDLGSGPNGFQAAHTAQERHPNLPVIYLTGRPGNRENVRLRPNERFLCKPFRMQELVEAMHSLGVNPPGPPPLAA
jgi:DNA-binding response OmpR family regulator